MLLDAVANPRPKRAPQEPGTVRVAGLLNLLDAAKALGGRFSSMADFTQREGPQMSARELWEDYRVYKDPAGAWILDTGPTYEGKPLATYGNMAKLQNEGVTLREYLDGTEMGDYFGPQLEQYRVGHLPLHDFSAGVNAPHERYGFTTDGITNHVDPGMLFIGSEFAGKPQTYPLFEHEFQHVLQNITKSPVGSNFDDAPQQMEFLQSQGRLPANAQQWLKAAAKINKEPGYAQPYYHSFGEVEARLAADRADPARAAKRPDKTDYSTAGGTFTAPDAWFRFYDADEVPMKRWWEDKWKKK